MRPDSLMTDNVVMNICDVEHRDDLQLVTDSQWVEAILKTINCEEGYGGLFIKQEAGQITECYGFYGIVPDLSKLLDKLI